MLDIFYSDGSVKRGDAKILRKLRAKQIWIDITNITKEESELLKERFDLHPLTVEDLLSSRVRVKIEEFPSYMFAVFYGVKNESFTMVELDFVIGKDYIISCHKPEIRSISELKKDTKRIDYLFKRGNDFLFHALLDKEIDNFGPVLEKTYGEIENIEKNILVNPTPDLLQKILVLKRHIMMIRKYTFPQREKISLLTRQTYKYLSKKALPYFRDLYDHSILVSDSVDNYRESIVNTVEVYMSAVNNRMNEIMKALSVIATIALPLTVISSIYGTNFIDLPGSHNPHGFWWMLIVMIVMSMFSLIYFKKRNWF